MNSIFYRCTLYVSNLCQTKTSKNKVDRSTMIDNMQFKFPLHPLSAIMSDNQQLCCSSPAMLRKHLLRELPVPQGLRSLWRFMTRDVDKQTKTFFPGGLLLTLSLIGNKLATLTVNNCLISVYFKDFYKNLWRQSWCLYETKLWTNWNYFSDRKI